MARSEFQQQPRDVTVIRPVLAEKGQGKLVRITEEGRPSREFIVVYQKDVEPEVPRLIMPAGKSKEVSDLGVD